MTEMTLKQCYEYIFIAVICLGLFIDNYITMREYGHRTLSGKYLLTCVLTLTASCLFEITYGMRKAGWFGNSEVIGYISEILYSVLIILSGYFWYIAAELYQNSPITATRTRRIVIFLPILFSVVLTVLTPFHRLVFYFENGQYVRGALCTPLTAIPILYIAGTGIMALINSFRKKFFIERVYFRIIFSYAVVILLFEVFQAVFGSVLPFRVIGSGLVIYAIQQKYLKENIYIDTMTGSNNRNATDRYLHIQFENRQQNLQVAMIDIDRFKQINDTYGHHAGDKAIKLIAKAFMKEATKNTFFARYGGDEFLLINTSDTAEELEKVVQNARIALKELCLQENNGLELDFSCGIVHRTAEMQTIPDILEAADMEMYRIKKAKKAAR